MRLLRDDRPPSNPADEIVCDSCRRDRSSRGSILYGSSRFCNGCATDYELLRAAGLVSGIEHYLSLGGSTEIS